ncbi:hypothetical protein HCJ99_25245, partial [Streptomyces sp. C1-2]|nr:hypothetical protein [Streptomyces sp. C1-2]
MADLLPLPPYIAVVGPGAAASYEAFLARQVGNLLAEHGAVVVCGGFGCVMEACAEGASAAGGVVVGVLPGGDRTLGNRYLTHVPGASVTRSDRPMHAGLSGHREACPAGHP